MSAVATMMKEPPSLFAWVAGASVALHAALVFVLPTVTAKTRFAASTIEIMDLPPPPPVPPPTAAPAPTEAAPVKATAPRTTAAAPKDQPSPAMAPPTSEAPLDFTGTVFSGEGPGVAVATPAPAAPFERGGQPTPAARVAETQPRFVPVSDLAHAPRPPALDAALERNYPIEARRAGVSGNAVLRVQILADGRIGVVERLSETFRGFGESCERTVRSARWEAPADRAGAAVTTRITYTCRFEVRS